MIVAVVALAFVITPVAIAARPAASSAVGAGELARAVQSSTARGWSGTVHSTGTLQIPDSDSFAGLAQLLGEDNDLRVWWRGADDWRVDRVRSTGETDLFRTQETSTRWVFESETATISPVSKIRLPDASDLLPPVLARNLLQGVNAGELSRLPTRRVAGHDAAGLRLTPSDAVATIAHVDVWVEPSTGLALAVELYAKGAPNPVVTSAMSQVDLRMPEESTSAFRPAVGVKINYDDAVDVAASANAFFPFALPSTLGGLSARNGELPRAVGIYGRGPTTVIVIPLRGQVAGPLRQRLRSSGAVQNTTTGTLVPVGPIGLLLTPRRYGGSFLLAGTVSGAALQRVAADLEGGGQ